MRAELHRTISSRLEMPFEQHPVFDTPPDETVIWRYLSFAKFVSLLASRSLYFPRADTLGDPFEGSSTQANLDAQRQALDALSAQADHALNVDSILASMSSANETMRRSVVVSCWHMSRFESMAMWRLYAGTEGSLAIRSTVGRLKQAVAAYTARPIYIGAVQYIDYDADGIPAGNMMTPFLYKRGSFEHEHEMRAVVMGIPLDASGNWDTAGSAFPSGLLVPIDVVSLLEAVHVAPGSEPWVRDALRASLSAFEVDVKLVASALDSPAVF